MTDETKNVLKAFSKTDDELVVGNYIVLFGGRDLTAFGVLGNMQPSFKNADGSAGEYFLKSVKLESGYTAMGRLPVDWEHGLKNGVDEPGPDDVLGYVDWSTKAIDDKGVFVKRILNRRNQYIKWLETLIDEGLIGTSTEPVQSGVKKSADGGISVWPLMKDTLTVTPMEPRMMSDNAVRAMKALKFISETDTGAAGQPEPDGSTATPQRITPKPRKASAMTMPTPGGQPPAQQPPAQPPAPPQQQPGQPAVFELDGEYFVYLTDASGEATGEPTAGPFPTPDAAKQALNGGQQQPPAQQPPAQAPAKPNPVKGITTMSDENVTVPKAEWDALQTDMKTLKAKVNAAPENTGGAAEPRSTKGPFKTLGEQLGAIKNLALGVGNVEMAHNKLKAVQENLKATGASEQLGADAGFPLQQEFSTETLGRVYGTGELMKRVRQRTVGAGFNGIKVNVINETSRVNGSRFGGVQAYWLNEAGTFTGSRPKMRQFDLPLEKIIGLYYATDEILQDLVALESDVNEAFSAEIMFKCEDAIINGSGVGLPQGIVGHASVVSVTAESGQSAATVLYKNLSKMYARLWAADRQGAAWFINQDVTPTLDDLFQAVGTAGIPPYFVTYSPDGIMKIKGLPVVTLEYCQTAGTVGDIILGNFDNYRWADKGGIKSDSSIHVAFTTAEQAFRWQYRANGKPFDIAPLTPKNGSNTLAHFVTLATRS